MYGQLRILYDNEVTQAMITPSSQATGQVTAAIKTGDGVATMAISGSFAGAFDLTYTLEIDSVAGGKEVGEATFQWKTDYSSGWEETGVLTRTTPAIALSADGLGTALSVAFTGGVADDFALADEWKWFARATYGRERLLDRNRNTVFRTAANSANWVVDLGSAKAITAFLIQDHNLSSGATVTLEANTSDSWGSPAYTYTFSSIEDPLYLYLSQTYRYWRLVILDGTLSYIEMSNLFLGSYVTLDKVNADWGSSRTDGYNLQANISAAGVMRRYAYSRSRKLNLSFGNTMKQADIDKLIALQEAIVDLTTYRVLPFWIHLFYDSGDDLCLMEWENLAELTRTYFSYLLHSGVTLQLTEAVKV